MDPHRVSREASTVIVCLVAAASLLGCTENLRPRQDAQRPFTLWGVLSPDLSIQSIRVYPHEDFPTLGSAQPLNADVFSTDLESGARITWRDTVLAESSGHHEYIFWAPFRAEFGHSYRAEAVRRSDGGFGFLGGGYRIVEPLFPSRNAVELACFAYAW